MTDGRSLPVLLDALTRVAAAMDEQGRDHVFIGGIALAAWGRPRTTVDIDLMIFGPEDEADQIIAALAETGFALESEIERDVMMSGFRLRKKYRGIQEGLPEMSVALDVLLSSNPVVRQIIERACRRKVGGVAISVPSAEDFIVLKLQAGRMQDLADAQAVYREHQNSLNQEHLEATAEQFAVRELLDRIRSAE
jgi:predicted nucleotidyltransferase